ncbi:DNA ligase D [Polaromonas sp.]|uniref:DNA ligase D n=1 Tax=Polaromonas sp. TaxID=1869339 RepID=UPI0018400236|nr:DNA ligase D [Polaromonas sp.]NMM05103.1 DNA ligase D [Polaromonas sp.]
MDNRELHNPPDPLDPLGKYRAKRDFMQTPEPAEGGQRADQALTFVIQKHAARNLHYDFRLELQGSLKSWAVPKGPSLDPAVKRMAVQVEDHPISYASFEGLIPPKQYGSGNVIVWDRGIWTPLGDAEKGLQSGKLKFELHGEKLKGGWTLVRMHGRSDEKQPTWLLIKERDEHARAEQEFDALRALPDSVLSGKPLPAKPILKAGAKALRKTPQRSTATKAPSPGRLPAGAVKAALPDSLAPQLAMLVTRVPADAEDWMYEIKFDGYRLLTRIEGASVRCFTRNGKDWSAKLPALVKAAGQLGLGSGWLDGEIVMLNDKGLPDFGALQNVFDSAHKADAAEIVYFVFDLPYADGLDLRALALTERRDRLRAVLARQPQGSIRFSEAFAQAPQDLLASAKRLGLEGVVGKRASSHYRSSHSPDWIKLKTQLRQEFVIGGYTAPKGARAGLGALLLGVHDADETLCYVGNVGTGFSEKTLRDLQARLSQIHSERSPFAALPAAVKGQWVKPQLLAEVSFAEWTHAGRIRHAVFQGLRLDKAACHIVRESAVTPPELEKGHAVPPPSSTPTTPSSESAPSASPALRTLRLTHPERVIDPSSGFTKKNLVEHYASVAALILPHLKARPVSLVRAPSGIEGELFVQKHAEATSIPGIKLLDPKLDPGHAPLLEIATADALLAATQLNVVEFHTWNATSQAIGKPDRMIFDLDPGEGVGWPEVQEAAQLVRTLLDELGLTGFLKTSGGKGLHVVVPLKRGHDFATVKNFSHAMVTHLARVLPQRFVAISGPKNRVKKIFVDYLRNGFGATTVAAWSVRARPGLGVSVPVAWDELPALTGGAHWTARTLGGRLATGNQPWSNYASSAQRLTAAMKRLDFNPAAQAK